jgi:hypothetical protein
MKAACLFPNKLVEDQCRAFVIPNPREPVFITLRGPYLAEAGEGFRAPREGPEGEGPPSSIQVPHYIDSIEKTHRLTIT